VANKRKLLERVRNNPRDVRFSDLVSLLEAHGFVLDRVEGSHRVYKHAKVREMLNIQPRKDGKAKPYQVREFLARVKEYGLEVENEG
jgi:predicted RNA binding protein YcfA (HicA-like mRNA interferase family)